MDLIYTDADMVDQGVLLDYNLDLAFGSGENNFELTVSTNNNVCTAGSWIYIDGTEYGGIVDEISVDTNLKQIKYKGRTYHGLINSKIVQPDPGEDYYIVTGEANTILGSLITRLGLGDLFEASSEASGISISSYQFYRYIEAYTGINKMLASVQAKLHIEFKDGKVKISAVPSRLYDDDELDSDHVNFDIEQAFNSVNHLICLGGGELKDRMVRHLYCDASGNISQTQSLFGMDEYAATYDYSSVESEDELISSGTERLKELNVADTISISLDNTYDFDVNDVINVTDVVTGISVQQAITKKIVTIKKGIFKTEYKVGE